MGGSRVGTERRGERRESEISLAQAETGNNARFGSAIAQT